MGISMGVCIPLRSLAIPCVSFIMPPSRLVHVRVSSRHQVHGLHFSLRVLLLLVLCVLQHAESPAERECECECECKAAPQTRPAARARESSTVGNAGANPARLPAVAQGP